MWTLVGAVLIDPAAHGGHRETDLAMLALRVPRTSRRCSTGIRRTGRCGRAGGTASGCISSIQLLAHVVLFGGGYARQTLVAATSALRAGKQREA